MKKLLYIITICLITFSCEDVVEIDVPTTEPKLIIDASINWFKGTAGNEQEIKLTLSAPYFDTEVPPANNALISITDTHANTFTFVEDANTGIYKNNTFIPEINGVYNLSVTYNSETYTASETLLPVASIDYIEQDLEGGFTGEETEIKAYYTDPADQENYYFFEFISDIPVIPSLEVYDDEFTNGNQIFAFYTEEDLESGDEVTIKNYGVSERFYEFMTILLQQTGGGGGPFEAQPATVRGNCINKTNPDNFPLGYFRVSEADEFIYTIEE